MVAGSRAMGRGCGHPRPGTAAFPNFAGAEMGRCHCSSPVGVQNWGAKDRAISPVPWFERSEKGMEASRTGRTELCVFSGRGWTRFRVRAGHLPPKMLMSWLTLRSIQSMSWHHSMVLNLSSTGLAQTDSPRWTTPDPPGPHGLMAPRSKVGRWEKGTVKWKGTPPVVHGHRESNCAKTGEFSILPALACGSGGWSPHRVGPAGQSVEAISGDHQ
jgi:hypothetical protein